MIMNKLKLMPLVPFVMALVCGMVSGYFVSFPLVALLLSMGIFVFASLLTRKNLKLQGAALLLCTMTLGAFLMERENARLTPLMAEADASATVVVDDEPKVTEWGVLVSCVVVGDKEENGTGMPLQKGARIRCSWREPSFVPSVGQTIVVRGRLRATGNADGQKKHVAGNFNYERWLKSHSYAALMTCRGDNVSLAEEGRLDEISFSERVAIKAKVLRHRIIGAFEKEGVEGEEMAVIAAMGFGDKSTLTENTREVFSQTGAAHLLALSGMHLGILFVLLTMFVSHLNFFFMPHFDARYWGQILVVATIWGYVVMVGMPQSVVRSAVMLTIYAAISSSERQKMSLNTLAFTAIVMLLMNPMAIWDVGFQMSFMAMAGIFVFHTPIYNIISMEWLFEHPIMRKVWSLVCVSTAAQIGTMPLAVYYFGRIPVLFLLTNLVAIPLVTMLLYGVFLCLVMWAIPFVRALLLLAVQGLSNVLTSTLGVMANWDIVSINNISINWIQMMLIYMMIIVVAIIIDRMRRIYKRQKIYSMLK